MRIIRKSIKDKSESLLNYVRTETGLNSNRRNQMHLPLVSPGCFNNCNRRFFRNIVNINNFYIFNNTYLTLKGLDPI